MLEETLSAPDSFTAAWAIFWRKAAEPPLATCCKATLVMGLSKLNWSEPRDDWEACEDTESLDFFFLKAVTSRCISPLQYPKLHAGPQHRLAPAEILQGTWQVKCSDCYLFDCYLAFMSLLTSCFVWQTVVLWLMYICDGLHVDGYQGGSMLLSWFDCHWLLVDLLYRYNCLLSNEVIVAIMILTDSNGKTNAANLRHVLHDTNAM